MSFCAGCGFSGSVSGSQPAWFPDSNRLVYVVTRGCHSELVEYDLASLHSHPLILKVPGGEPSTPAISPDGSRIAFSVANDAKGVTSDIYVAESTGQHPRKIFSDGYNNSRPVFSANGRAVIFVKSRVFTHYSPIVRPRLHEMDLDAVDLTTGTETPLTNYRAYQISSLAVNPKDGSIVAMVPGKMDPLWHCPLFTLTRFKWTPMRLEDPEELRPNLSAFLETDPWSVKWRNYYPWRDIYSVAFDARGHLYFLWPTTNAKTGYYDYETYRWDADTNRTQRVTNLHRMIEEVRPSPDGKWLAIPMDNRALHRWRAPRTSVYVYSIADGYLIELPSNL